MMSEDPWGEILVVDGLIAHHLLIELVGAFRKNQLWEQKEGEHVQFWFN